MKTRKYYCLIILTLIMSYVLVPVHSSMVDPVFADDVTYFLYDYYYENGKEIHDKSATATDNRMNLDLKKAYIHDEIQGYPVRNMDEWFLRDSKIEEISLPDTITYHKYNILTFSKVKQLRKATFRSSMVSDNSVKWPNYMFKDDINLEEIYIGKHISDIGDFSFAYCERLSKINVDPTSPYLSSENNVLYNKNKTTLFAYPRRGGAKTFNIPKSVKIIDNDAFGSVANLEEVNLPEGLTSIGIEAFSDNPNLKTVYIPKSVTKIGSDIVRGSPNAIIECYKDSYSYNYCINNGLKYKLLDEPTIVLNTSSAVLSIGRGFQIKFIKAPLKNIKWISSSPSIASVDQNGNVKALKAGYTYIIARTADGSEAKCLVQVIDVAPKLNVTNATLSIGKGFQAKVTNISSGITWKSSSPSIASVDAKGNVKTLKAGYTYIIAKTANGKEVKCLVKVVDTSPTSISMNLNNAMLSIGKSFNARASVYPTNAMNKNVTWSSGNTKVVKVDQTGKVTSIGAGTTYVYAKTSNGITGKILVKVLPNPTSVAITPKSATVRIGTTFRARGIVTPSNAATAFTFKSSSPSVATVDANGNVKALRTGATYISVTTANGKTAKFLLRVVK